MTPETIKKAFLETEKGFTSLVSQLWNSRPDIATVGSCCLVGVVYQQTLFVANVGDSRVVLGRKVGNTGGITAIQLSKEHNANLDNIRRELRDLHPLDPQIVVLKHGVWRVKGIIQVSYNITDMEYMNALYMCTFFSVYVLLCSMSCLDVLFQKWFCDSELSESDNIMR